MSDVSAKLKRAVFAEQTEEVFIRLLKIDHANLTNPIRICSDAVPVTHNNAEYTPFPFEINLPAEEEDRIPDVTLKIDAVDRIIIRELRQLNTPPDVTLRVVLASDPDVTEVGPFTWKLRGASYNVATVSGELRFEDLVSARYPADSFTPANFPGLF